MRENLLSLSIAWFYTQRSVAFYLTHDLHKHNKTRIRIEILMAVINKIQDVFGTTFGLCGVVEMPNCGIWKKINFNLIFVGFKISFRTRALFHTLSWMGSAVVVATCWDWGSGETWTWLTSFFKKYIIIVSLKKPLKIPKKYLLLYWLDRFINKLYILVTAHHDSATGILPQTDQTIPRCWLYTE